MNRDLRLSEGDVLGRDRELGRVEVVLSALEHGPSRLLVVGDPGIGKSTVWRAGVAFALARGYRVLQCQPAKAEQHLSHAGLTDMLEGVPDAFIDGLPEPQRVALGVALLRRAADATPPAPRAVFAALLTTLERLAADGPVLVAVDDLQWLDASSASALRFVARRVQGSRIGVLATMRTASESSSDLNLAGWFEPSERLRLSPLSAAGLQRLLSRRLGMTLPRRTLLRLHARCSGNAFYALEIAERLAARPALYEDWPIPSDVRDLVDARLRRVPGSEQRALLLAAAAARPTPELVGPRGMQLGMAAGLLELQGERVRFTHPLYASALYDGASAGERAEVHRALATWENDLEQRARHLGLATADPDDDVAAQLEHASEVARRRGSLDVAAELADRARLLTPPGCAVDLARRTIRAAEYEFHAGSPARASLLLEDQLKRSAAGPSRADALRLMAEIRYHEDSFPEAIALLMDAREHVGSDDSLAAAIELRLAYTSVIIGDFAGSLPHAGRSLSLARQLGDEGLLAEALATHAMVEFLLGRGLDEAALEQALLLEDPDRQSVVHTRPTLVAACLMLYSGRLARSSAEFRKLRQRILDRGDESDLVYVAGYFAWLECWRGDLASAEAHFQESAECASRLGPSQQCTSLAFGSLVSALAGDVALTHDRAQRCTELALETGYGLGLVWASWALAINALSLGDPRAAVAALAPFVGLLEQDGLGDPIRLPFIGDAIEALIATGEGDRAERLLVPLEESASRLQRTWALVVAGRCRAMLHAANGRIDQAAEAVASTLPLARSGEMPLELARTLLAQGQIARRRRRKREACEALTEATEIFEQCGARAWTALALRELKRGLAPRSPHDLTTTEERIAGLAASGLTNREIAAAAFVSEKTVEANLSHIYRKLGIRSRAELGVRLATREERDGAAVALRRR